MCVCVRERERKRERERERCIIPSTFFYRSVSSIVDSFNFSLLFCLWRDSFLLFLSEMTSLGSQLLFFTYDDYQLTSLRPVKAATE